MTSGNDKKPDGVNVHFANATAASGGAMVNVNVAGASEARRNKLPNYSGHPVITGRGEDLAAISRVFAEPVRAEVLVLHGPPGVGKTRIAVEYALTHWDSYPGGVFFVSLDLARPTELADLLAGLGLKRDADEPLEDQCRRALAGLGARPTLLLYDNVPDERVLAAWLPTGGLAYHVLATSTCAYWLSSRKAHPVDLLSDDAASALVNTIVRDQSAARRWAEQLVRKARGITVELCAAANAVDYETSHGRGGELGEPLADETTSSFAGAWRILTDDARLVLQSACLFETSRIPPEVLRALWHGEGWSDARFNKALDAARDRTLVMAKGEALDVHQCVARFVREQREPTIPDTVRERHFDGFVSAARRFSEHPGDPKLSAVLRAYPADAAFWDVVLPRGSSSTTGRPNDENGAHFIGYALGMDGRFDEARPWFERAVAAAEKGDINGRIDHESLGVSLHQVGTCYARTGRYEEARGWLERAVAEAEKGDINGRIDHESLGTSLHQVGDCYSSTGRYEEARTWFERAVAAKEKGDVHGRIDHVSLGTSLHLVGYCYSSTGRYEEARTWFERAVAAAEKGDVHGRIDHESLGTSLHQVGDCYSSTGRYEEARTWFERAVAAKEKGDVHGRIDHVSLGTSLHLVGYCYSSTGRYEEARTWFERAVAAAEKGDVHGRIDHESLGTSLHQVGDCYSSTGRYEEARTWFERAVAAAEKGDVHGRIDPASLGSSLHQVGYCYSSTGRDEEARTWFERAVAAKEKGDVHGRIDPASLGTSLHQVGSCYSRTGRPEEARTWFEHAVAAAEKGDVHGRIDHESLGKSLDHAGYCSSSTGRYEEARTWFERAVAAKEKGDVHGRIDQKSLEASRSALASLLARS